MKRKKNARKINSCRLMAVAAPASADLPDLPVLLDATEATASTVKSANWARPDPRLQPHPMRLPYSHLSALAKLPLANQARRDHPVPMVHPATLALQAKMANPAIKDHVVQMATRVHQARQVVRDPPANREPPPPKPVHLDDPEHLDVLDLQAQPAHPASQAKTAMAARQEKQAHPDLQDHQAATVNQAVQENQETQVHRAAAIIALQLVWLLAIKLLYNRRLSNFLFSAVRRSTATSFFQLSYRSRQRYFAAFQVSTSMCVLSLCSRH